MGLFGKLLWIIPLAYFAFVSKELVGVWFPPTCDPAPCEGGSAVCGSRPRCLSPAYGADDRIDVKVHISTQAHLRDVSSLSPESLAWSLGNISMHEGVDEIKDVPIPKKARTDGKPVYVYVVVSKAGTTTAKTSRLIVAGAPLTRLMVPLNQNKTYLIDSTEDENTLEERKRLNGNKPIPHLRPHIKVRLIDTQNSYPANNLPYHMQHDGKHYQPHVYIDDFSLTRLDWIPLSSNTSKATAPVHLHFVPTSVGLFRLLSNFEVALQTMQTTMGFTEKETDDVKSMFTNASLTMLLLTYAVTILHVIFDFLAFKNDIGFWKGRTDLLGLSRRAVVMNFVCALIIFLYLFDNSNTSFLILLSAFSSVVIDAWKVTKVLHVRAGREGWLPTLRLSLTKPGEKKDETGQFDEEAMRYLQYALYPFVALGAIYSLVYSPHKSWYSWLIESLANGVYMFGFIMMTPQLFINYKLKSVAHLPWRVLTYKAFNTFIDDVFSFIISMPMTHRLACLRDDVIFFIYLYQRWLYPVDMKRVNEYGYSYEEQPKDGTTATATAPATTATATATESEPPKAEEDKKND